MFNDLVFQTYVQNTCCINDHEYKPLWIYSIIWVSFNHLYTYKIHVYDNSIQLQYIFFLYVTYCIVSVYEELTKVLETTEDEEMTEDGSS